MSNIFDWGVVLGKKLWPVLSALVLLVVAWLLFGFGIAVLVTALATAVFSAVRNRTTIQEFVARKVADLQKEIAHDLGEIRKARKPHNTAKAEHKAEKKACSTKKTALRKAQWHAIQRLTTYVLTVIRFELRLVRGKAVTGDSSRGKASKALTAAQKDVRECRREVVTSKSKVSGLKTRRDETGKALIQAYRTLLQDNVPDSTGV